MKINGNKVDTTGIKFTSRTVTQDPIQYSAIATVTINGSEYQGDFIGDTDDSRTDCKVGAYLSLKANCKNNGINL
jgi:hypothetical protein